MVYCIKTSYDFREFVNERKKKRKKKHNYVTFSACFGNTPCI